ncbi:MAG: hypothetical protein JNL08_17380 [Planctomycetes bacterium]|nr:hypothetical protein [Planctomycetota bacterium]
MKAWKLLFAVPFVVAALAMVPQGQDKPGEDFAVIATLSELHYTTPDGQTKVVGSRELVEIRVLTDHTPGIRLELVYDNGDYSMVDAQSFHLLRNAGSTREVKLIRGHMAQMRFPKLP